MKKLRIIVACEHSKRVRNALRKKGHDAYNCDWDDPTADFYCDIREVIEEKGPWDMMIAFPDCTFLCVSGLHWNKKVPGRSEKTEAALEFVCYLLNAPIDKIGLENPVGCISTRVSLEYPHYVISKDDKKTPAFKASQYVQPYQFGHAESKKTGLWLKNLPLLMPTKIVEPSYYTLPDGTIYRDGKGQRYSKTHYTTGRLTGRYKNQTPSGQNKLGPGTERSKIRGLTYQGIADAIAEQWTSGRGVR